MRGRKPTPTHLKVISGNPGKRRISGAEPDPTPDLPTPPPELCADAKAEWARISEELHRLKLLSGIDRAALAAYCQAYGRWVQAERGIRKMAEKDPLAGGMMIKTTNGNAVQNPLVGIANKAMADVVRYAAEFGMTPSARARLAVEAADAPKSKFEGLIGGRKA